MEHSADVTALPFLSLEEVGVLGRCILTYVTGGGPHRGCIGTGNLSASHPRLSGFRHPKISSITKIVLKSPLTNAAETGRQVLLAVIVKDQEDAPVEVLKETTKFCFLLALVNNKIQQESK